MNIFLKENQNSKVGKLVEKIKSLISGSIFEGQVYIVGGTIRDFIIYGEDFDEKCHDVDMVISAPDGGLAFATWATYNTGCFVQSKNPCMFETYGTAKFQFTNDPELKDIEIECVQTRKEKYNKESRNPATAYGTIEEDAMRRDLTINALYYNISTDEICDFTKMGLDDIKNGIIRTTGDANLIFDDDPLRILRVVRFATRLGWPIEKKTWIGMVTNSNRVTMLTQERVTDELNKMLVSDHPSEAIDKLDKCNVLDIILPSLTMSKHVYQDLRPKRDLYEHTLEVINKTPNRLETRLAAVFHDIGKLKTYTKNFFFHQEVGAEMTSEILKSMKYSNAIISKVVKAVEKHEAFSSYMGSSVPRPSVIRQFVSDFNGDEDALNIALDLIHANNISQMYGKKIKQVPGIRAKIAELDKKNESGKKIVVPINGNDIMAEFNLRPSAVLGTLMTMLKKKVIEKPDLTKEEAFKAVEEYLKKVV